MADLQVVFLRDLMPVKRVEPLDIDPPALRITGNRMSAAAAVLVNGVEAPSFIVTGRNTVIAEIPTAVLGDLIRSVAVLSDRIVSTNRSILSMRLGGTSSKVRGILRMVQRYALMMLSSPGSDIVHPEDGGGLQDMVGKVVSGSGKNSSINAAIQKVVTRTNASMRRIETNSSFLEPDERFASGYLAGVLFDQKTTTLAVRVQLESAAGEAAVANLIV